MRKWMRFLSPISLPPSNLRELIPWLLFKLLYWLIGPIGLLIMAGVLILVTFFAFMISDYNGSPQGSYNNSADTVTLSTKQQALNDNIDYNASKVANTGESGLSSDEIQAVNQANLEVPDGLLLAIGKVVDNLKSSNMATFKDYYSYFQPIHYTFIHKTDVSIKYDHIWVPKHCTTKKEANGKIVHDCTPAHWECKQTETDTPVTLITYANTWNGTYTATYKKVITGSKGCPGGSGSRTWTSKWVIQSYNRVYSWSKVWNLFKHIKTTVGWFTDNQDNTNMLAGLIAIKNPSIDDPTVQAMKTSLEFIQGTIPAMGNGLIPTVSSQDIIKNVEAWKSYINYFAGVYQVPPILIAGHMAAESHGEQYGGFELNGDGTLTLSSTGAMGLMQVEPTTAQGLTVVLPTGQLQYVGNKWFSMLSNPVTNISIGSDYIGNLYKEFNNNITEELAAYNAGPGAEEAALAGTIPTVNINGVPIPNIQQTVNYVNIIEQTYMPQLQGNF